MDLRRRILVFSLNSVRLIFGTSIFTEWLGSILFRRWPYKYQPLPITTKDEALTDHDIPQKSAIRVLRVNYAGERTGIKCSLTNLEGLQSQEYHCLSYTWGNPFGPDVDYVIRSRSRLEIRLESVVSVFLRYCRQLRRFFQPEHYVIGVDDGFLLV